MGRIFLCLALVLAHPACSDAGGGEVGIRGKIAFYSMRNGRADIFVVDADGGNLRCLTRAGPGGKCPAFSPDGKLIAFQPNRGGNEDIYVMDVDGKNLRRVTDSPSCERHAAWSPDVSQAADGLDPLGFFSLFQPN